MNLLAIRLPGIRPDILLNAICPIFRLLFTKTVFTAYAMLLVAAFLIAITNWGEIAGNVSTAFANRSFHTWVQLFVILGLVKIAHELGHAVACKSLGGDCRELGIMLLMGTPCLYCDVSDAWLMRERWKRIVVSAAGMLTELGIASVATLLWAVTGDADLRQWWLIIMVVCSISTIAINGNPLMRYDGYFIFSDLVGIPNLASRANAALHRMTRRWLWGETLVGSDADETRHQILLAAYAMLSGLYRMMILATFVIGVYQFTSSRSFAIVGILLAAFLAFGTITPIAKAVLSPPRFFSQVPRRSMRTLIVVGSAVAALSMFLIPLPRTLVVPMTIRPEHSQELFVSVGGRLTQSVTERTVVQKGSFVAVFDNASIRAELLDAECRFEQLDTQEKGLLAQRASNSDVTPQLVDLGAAKQSLADRIALLRAEVDKLSLATPRDGAVFYPTDRPFDSEESNGFGALEQAPRNTLNPGAWLEPGTIVCIVGHPSRREAILMADQKSASLIKEGQNVELLRPSKNANKLRGVVYEVGVSPVIDCPLELTSIGFFPTNESVDAMSRGSQQPTLYQVRVALDSQSESLPIRTVGFARVQLEPTSLWSRLLRVFFQSVRF